MPMRPRVRPAVDFQRDQVLGDHLLQQTVLARTQIRLPIGWKPLGETVECMRMRQHRIAFVEDAVRQALIGLVAAGVFPELRFEWTVRCFKPLGGRGCSRPCGRRIGELNHHALAGEGFANLGLARRPQPRAADRNRSVRPSVHFYGLAEISPQPMERRQHPNFSVDRWLHRWGTRVYGSGRRARGCPPRVGYGNRFWDDSNRRRVGYRLWLSPYIEAIQQYEGKRQATERRSPGQYSACQLNGLAVPAGLACGFVQRQIPAVVCFADAHPDVHPGAGQRRDRGNDQRLFEAGIFPEHGVAVIDLLPARLALPNVLAYPIGVGKTLAIHESQ
jgi:hypothetical protein